MSVLSALILAVASVVVGMHHPRPAQHHARVAHDLALIREQAWRTTARASRSAPRPPLRPRPRPTPKPLVPACVPTPSEQWIIARESGGDTHAYNPVDTSTGHAFGIGQLTTTNRVEIGRRLGIDPNTTDYCQQLTLLRGYVAGRYGSTTNAVAFWRRHGYF